MFTGYARVTCSGIILVMLKLESIKNKAINPVNFKKLFFISFPFQFYIIVLYFSKILIPYTKKKAPEGLFVLMCQNIKQKTAPSIPHQDIYL